MPASKCATPPAQPATHPCRTASPPPLPVVQQGRRGCAHPVLHLPSPTDASKQVCDTTGPARHTPVPHRLAAAGGPPRLVAAAAAGGAAGQTGLCPLLLCCPCAFSRRNPLYIVLSPGTFPSCSAVPVPLLALSPLPRSLLTPPPPPALPPALSPLPAHGSPPPNTHTYTTLVRHGVPPPLGPLALALACSPPLLRHATPASAFPLHCAPPLLNV